ncbi:MAG: response regulator [Candidatus Cloacimonetes bacterium]|nr:response regulator [Candidatus Cloacimonadota bacterium]
MDKNEISNLLKNARVMIVDDDITTLTLIERFVKKLGYAGIAFQDSQDAFARIDEVNPDALLLDYLMPNLDGYEFCLQLRQQKKWQNLPVIFITAMETTDTLVRVFEAGANDYIIKPFNPRELGVRLRNMLELSLIRRKLDEFGRTMQQQVEERTHQLVHADRLATLGTLSAGIAHEINNPTTFISSNLQTLELFWATVEKLLLSVEDNEGDFTRKVEFIRNEMPPLIAGMKNGVTRIHRITNSLKTYSRKEKIEKAVFDLRDATTNTMELCRNAIKKCGLNIDRIEPETPVMIDGDQQQIEQVLVNLVVNAADAMCDCETPSLSLTLDTSASEATYTLTDNGPGVREAILDKIWDPFFTTKAVGKGTGLGLSIVRSIIENHDGSIVADNIESGGLEFIIRLPLLKE